MTKIPYDELIDFYHKLNIGRPLEPHESARLGELITRQAWAIAQRKYREKNREKLNEKRREYAKAKPKKQAMRARIWRENNPRSSAIASKKWREKQKLNTE